MYTINNIKLSNQKINCDMEIIKKVIISEIKNVKAIILTGGFGRGEGSVIFKDNICQPLNDYDLVVVTNHSAPPIKLEAIRVDLAKLCGIRQVDISLVKYKNFSNMSFTMANYDLLNASKLIYGSLDGISNKPVWNPKKLPLKEGVMPLFLFLSSLIQSYPKHKELNQNEIFWSYQQITKSILGWSAAMLIFKGLYDSSYNQRNQLFQKEFTENKSLCRLVELATEFKLNPILNPCTLSELSKLWNEARLSHMESLKLLLPSFYSINFSSWDNLVIKHKNSFTNIIKMMLSRIFRRHHYYDCLNIDLAKLYLCLAIEDDTNEYLLKSHFYLKKISSVNKNKIYSSDINEYIDQLICLDKNAYLFFERGSDIFYE